MTCPECGAPVVLEPRPDLTWDVRVGGAVVTKHLPADVPVASCQGCRETYTTEAMEHAIAAALGHEP